MRGIGHGAPVYKGEKNNVWAKGDGRIALRHITAKNNNNNNNTYTHSDLPVWKVRMTNRDMKVDKED